MPKLSLRMPSSHRITQTLLVLLMLELCSQFGSALPTEAPSSPVNDETRLFDEAQTRDLNTRLNEVHAKLGVRFYIAAVTFANDKSARDTAARLAKAWAKGEATLVLAHDRGKEQSSVAVSPEFWARYPADAVVQIADLAAGPLRRQDITAGDKLLDAVNAVVPRLTVLERARRQRVQSLTRSELRLGLAMSGTLTVLMVLGALVIGIYRRREISNAQTHFFPVVEVSSRLGAPYGGGVLGESGTK